MAGAGREQRPHPFCWLTPPSTRASMSRAFRRLDETLLDTVDVTRGLKAHGAVIVNTGKAPAEIREKLSGWTGRVCTIDARRISEETLGKNFPNTPMLSAAVRVSGVLEEDQFKKDMEESFQHKFATKPQVVAGNMAALVKAWEEVEAG